MNILFIGPYRQSDAWGKTSKGFVKTLLSIEDFSVTARPIFMSDQHSGPVDADTLRCESNKKDSYDVLIQHMLPSFMVYDSRFCLLYTSPSPRDVEESRMPSSA